MTHDARARIDAHRLMQTTEVVAAPLVGAVGERSESSRSRFIRRSVVHAGAFAASFVFAAGTTVLGLLLFLSSSEDTARLVGVLLVSALVFVICFSGIRMFALHHVFDEYPDKEEDPGMHHHMAKSVAYGFVALAIAVFLAGLIMRTASAFGSL